MKRPVLGERAYEVGIFQSIGFKEFHDFLMLKEESQRDSDEGKNLFDKGKAAMKTSTRQYARRQVRWIRQRFLRSSDRECPPIYGLDSSDPARWDEVVRQPAFSIVQAFVDGTEVEGHQPLAPLAATTYSHEESRKVYRCETCDIHVKGRLQYEQHVKSKRHHKLYSKNAKRQKTEENAFSGGAAKGRKGRLEVRTEKELTRTDRMIAMKTLRSATGLALQDIKALIESSEKKSAVVESDLILSDEVKAELAKVGINVTVTEIME